MKALCINSDGEGISVHEIDNKVAIRVFRTKSYEPFKAERMDEILSVDEAERLISFIQQAINEIKGE